MPSEYSQLERSDFKTVVGADLYTWWDPRR